MGARFATLALVAALLGAHVASAQCNEPRNGWVLLKYLPSTEDVTGYRFQAGRVPGVYTETRSVDPPPPSNEYCFDGLASTGSWYFVARAVNDAGVSVDASNIACFTMTGGACQPGPYPTDVTAVSFRDAAAAPPSAGRVVLTWTWNQFSFFALVISNDSTVPINSFGIAIPDQTIDFVQSATQTAIPHAPSLGGNDGVGGRSVTINLPVPAGQSLEVRGDIDTRNAAGVTVTLNFPTGPVSVPLVATATGFAATRALP